MGKPRFICAATSSGGMETLTGAFAKLEWWIANDVIERCGFGESGMGAYHGRDGLDAFLHYKSIVDKKAWLTCPCTTSPIPN